MAERVTWRDIAKGIGEAAKEYAAGVKDFVANTVYSDLAKDYAQRGATEISNALYTGNAYGPGSSLIQVAEDKSPLPEAPAQEPEKDSPGYTPMIRPGIEQDNDRGMSR